MRIGTLIFVAATLLTIPASAQTRPDGQAGGGTRQEETTTGRSTTTGQGGAVDARSNLPKPSPAEESRCKRGPEDVLNDGSRQACEEVKK